MEKRIGKIKAIKFGSGGYQDAMLGFSFDLGSEKESWGVGDFWGHWASKPDKNSKWTEAQQTTYLGETALRVSQLMKDAKVDDMNDLAGVPIEVTFEGNTLKSWRVLTEVI